MPSHYLKQCWHIVNWTPENKFWWNLNKNAIAFIHGNAFQMLSAKFLPFCSSGCELTVHPKHYAHKSWFNEVWYQQDSPISFRIPSLALGQINWMLEAMTGDIITTKQSKTKPCGWFLGYNLIVRFVGPTWGPSGADRTQVSLMLAPWTLLSG